MVMSEYKVCNARTGIWDLSNSGFRVLICAVSVVICFWVEYWVWDFRTNDDENQDVGNWFTMGRRRGHTYKAITNSLL